MSNQRVFFYARVSSDSQSVSRQLDALNNFIKNNPDIKIDERDIFIEKKSGKDFSNRTEFNTLKRMLRKNDLLILCSLIDYRVIILRWLIVGEN